MASLHGLQMTKLTSESKANMIDDSFTFKETEVLTINGSSLKQKSESNVDDIAIILSFNVVT